jgi:hypothetical protein
LDQGAETGAPEGAASRYVDYEHVAAKYRRGRALPASVLERRQLAVQPYLPDEPLSVVDVGAGTGVFAAIWPDWGARAS